MAKAVLPSWLTIVQPASHCSSNHVTGEEHPDLERHSGSYTIQMMTFEVTRWLETNPSIAATPRDKEGQKKDGLTVKSFRSGEYSVMLTFPPSYSMLKSTIQSVHVCPLLRTTFSSWYQLCSVTPFVPICPPCEASPWWLKDALWIHHLHVKLKNWTDSFTLLSESFSPFF